jgi:hypothetical protein
MRRARGVGLAPLTLLALLSFGDGLEVTVRERSLLWRLFVVGLVIVGAALVSGCAGLPIVIGPPADPPAEKPPVVVEPPVVQPDPTPLCTAELSRSCWHMTPPSPAWQWRGRDGVTDYADPKAEPAPPVAQPPVAQPPAAGCSLDGLIDPDALEGIEPRPTIPAKLATDVNEAELAAGGCDNCVVGAYDPWVAKVAEGLRARGWCVGTRIHPDALAVSDPADLSINYAIHVHLAGGGAGRARWMPSAYVDAWRVTQTTPEGGQAKPGQPQAPETPSVPRACGDPVPLRTYPDGTAHWFFRCSPWGGPNANITDCSVKAQGQPEFCAAVWGKPDLNCDLGPEASAERACRERLLYGDPVVETRDGAAGWRYGGNPMQFQCAKRGGCRLCSTAEPVVCSEWF